MECTRQKMLHSPALPERQFTAVLGKGFGEACHTCLEWDAVALRRGLIRLAAIAAQWLEFLDNLLLVYADVDIITFD